MTASHLFFLLTWFILIIVEIFRNDYIIEQKGKRPVYWQSNIIRIAVGFVFWISAPLIATDITWYQWWGMAVMMIFNFWFFFDYGLNYVRNWTRSNAMPFFYLNPDGSFLDQFQCKYPGPYPWFWWKLILMAYSHYLFIQGINAAWTWTL